MKKQEENSKYNGFNAFINWTCRKKETKIEVVI